MKRTIKLNESELRNMITESVRRVLREAMDDSFSYEELTNFGNDFKGAAQYCYGHLGPVQGEGSSRLVFTIDDGVCLKLAKNNKGIEQNKVEASTKQMNSPLFPYIYKVAPNYLWVETEEVLPSNSSDVLQCLGLRSPYDFYYLIQMIKRIKYNPDAEEDLEPYYINDKYGLIDQLKTYILDYDIPIGDIMRLENWGLAKRDGHEHLVILDPGWNKETMKLYGGWPSS